jgi:Cu/Ag efflux protein CusF
LLPGLLKQSEDNASKWLCSDKTKEGGDIVKNAIKVVVLALTALSFSGLSFAQSKPATPSTPSADKKAETTSAKAKSNRITGEITSLDAKSGMVAVKGKDKEVNLTAESKKAKAALEKLKVGDMVTVSYSEKDGKMVASSVKADKSTASKSAKGMDKQSDMMEKKPATK